MWSPPRMLFEGMRQVAAQKQWQLDPADPGAIDTMPFRLVTLMGSEEGVPLRLERCAGNHTFMTSAFIEPAIPWTFVISHQGLGGDLANLVGFKDIEIGDKEFDKTFRVVSKEVDKTKGLLTPEVQTYLKRLDLSAKDFGSRFQVTENAVSLTRAFFTPMSADQILYDVPTAIGLVRALKDAGRAYR